MIIKCRQKFSQDRALTMSSVTPYLPQRVRGATTLSAQNVDSASDQYPIQIIRNGVAGALNGGQYIVKYVDWIYIETSKLGDGFDVFRVPLLPHIPYLWKNLYTVIWMRMVSVIPMRYCLLLTLESSQYGSFSSERYVECYNFTTDSDFAKIKVVQ